MVAVQCPKCPTLYLHDSLIEHPRCPVCGTVKVEEYVEENRDWLRRIQAMPVTEDEE